MNYVSRFNKETAVLGHNGTLWASNVFPENVKAPFGAAWGYLEGKSQMEAHSHPTHEIYTVFSGRGICEVNGTRFEVVPGDVINIPPDAVHTMICEAGESILWAAYWWGEV